MLNIAWTTKPSPNRKDRIKTRQRDTHIQAHMAGLEPTETQLGLLRETRLGGQPAWIAGPKRLLPSSSLSRSSGRRAETPRHRRHSRRAEEPPQWVVWRLKPDAASPPKCRLAPQPGGDASSTDPATWATFKQAVEAAAAWVCWHRLCVYRL